MSISADLQLPAEEELLRNLHQLAQQQEPIARCLAALETGTFHHPDGRTDTLQVRITQGQAALISHLCLQCPKPLSVEVGFGMGSSAAVILATRHSTREPFEHVVFDPFGSYGEGGTIVQSYLQKAFSENFRRVEKKSAIGLAELIASQGERSAGLVHVDGGHRYEDVMGDFILADMLCCKGGFITLDDAAFPAIETVVNYVKANRPDYAVAHLPVHNLSALKKIGEDRRAWFSFKPFEVPNRQDWTSWEDRKH